ncbi:hypothetical protein ACFL3H_07920 [Gemmatimonadota bacterium]
MPVHGRTYLLCLSGIMLISSLAACYNTVAGPVWNDEKINSCLNIRGAITDFSTGNPVSDVTIRLYSKDILSTQYWDYGEQDWKFVRNLREIWTDSLGHYAIQYEWMGGSDDITFKLIFQKMGYSTERILNIPSHEYRSTRYRTAYNWNSEEPDTINVQLKPITP